jgi:translocation and assembly module TamB
LELKQAAVNWAGAQARLTEPLRIRIQGDQTSIQGAAKMESFDLSSVSNAAYGALDGRVAAELRLGGTLAAPEFEGEASCHQLAARAKGWVPLPPVDGSGRFSVSGGVLRISAKAGMATNGSAHLKAQMPVQVSLVPWELSLDGNRDLSVDVEAGLNLARLVDSEANPALGALEGRLDADLRVRGTPAHPRADGEVRCKGLSTQTGMLEPVPAVGGSCRYGYSNGILRADAEAGTATNGSARLQAQIPAQVSLVPWELSLDRERDLLVELDAGLDLAALNGLDVFANGRIGGRIDLSVAHVGSISSGAVTGSCVLVGGEYENYSLGTVIRKGQLKLVSSGKTLVVESGSATDGGKGRLTLSGNIRPDPSAGLPYELEIAGRQMRLLRRPDAEVTMSGQLALEGTLSRLRAVGDWQIDNALVNLGNLRPSPPAELEPAPVDRSPAAAARAPNPEAFVLRLGVAIPGSLYVRSGMLDTAWAGNLALAHERGKMGLSGYLEPRRGTVLLLKRPFKLEEGRIDFDGRWPPEPTLRLAAVYTRADLSARARITGPARDPEIALTSEPPLPEDEILSRILFGENMSSLTPLQAVSLASEAAKLRDVGGGGGVLHGVTAAMGIDRVELRENGQNSGAAEVAVGKYLGDKSYVEMRRAATIDSSGGARVFLEHELRPNVVLEAESGLEMRSGLGLFWKRDY